MKISDNLKEVAYKTANRVIEKFRNKKLKDEDEELIVIEATMIKVGIEKIPSVVEEQKKSRKNEGIEITEDFILFMICKNNHLFNRIYNNFSLEDPKEVSIESIIKDWKLTKNQYEGIEKYFNTKDEHFNNNAYFWYLHLKGNELFPDIELPFEILSEYLYFLDNFRTPISCVEKLKKKMDENNLTKKQRIFIYDKINGLIANADIETQDKLSHINIEILDNRWKLEPYEDLNPEQYSIEYIIEEATKHEDPYERLKFLKHRKLQYERETKELDWDIGLGDEIQVEIEILEKRIKDKNFGSWAMESTRELLEKVKEFISKGQTIKAIDLLLSNCPEDKLFKSDIYLLSGQWKELEKKVDLGLINDKDAELTRNRISNAILKLASDL